MASEYMALNAIPTKGIGEQYFNGYEQGQRIAANNYMNQARGAQAQSADDARQAQILIRAMQLGLDSPEEWDNAMQSAAKAGSRDASNFIGQWNPVRSEQLLHSYMNAYGLTTPGTPAAQRAIGTAASADGDAAAEGPQYGEGTVQAIARMSPEERRKKVMQYDHAVNAMSHVNNEADLAAMVEDLKGRGILDDNAARHYMQMFSDPVSKWRNFRAVRKQITGLRDHLAEYTAPQELGITPVGPEPTYKTEWDQTNGIGVTTTMAPGKAPSFSVTKPGGIGQGPSGAPLPKGMKDQFEMESTTRKSWGSDVAPLLTQKQAIDAILSLDEGKTNGVEELSAIYSMVKALDPTSVVREGEIDLLNQAQSLVGRIQNLAGKAQAGHLLTPAVLKQMKQAATNLKNIAKKTYDWRRGKTIQSISKFQPYIDPDSAVPDYWQSEVLPPPPGGNDTEIHEQEGRF